MPQRWGLPRPPSLGRLSASPWLLPKYSAAAACATLAATVLSALLAGYDCDCFWLHDFNRYETISGLAMHPPMTVVTPAGVIPSALLLIASAWAALKLALASPYYRSGAAKAALGLWCCNAMNSALWGTGVNVFFNESWDHDSHIQLSYYYFGTHLPPVPLLRLLSADPSDNRVSGCCSGGVLEQHLPLHRNPARAHRAAHTRRCSNAVVQGGDH